VVVVVELLVVVAGPVPMVIVTVLCSATEIPGNGS
jgi:hypothetical protein